MEVEVERRTQLHGSADTVVELFDNWEGMSLLSIRFGTHDGDENIAWGCEEQVLDADMARALALQFIEYADNRSNSE